MEPFHRERKQLIGVQACQCRLTRSQRNHIALAVRPGPGSNKPPTRPEKRCISSNKGFWMRICGMN